MKNNLDTTGYWNFNSDIENSYAGEILIEKKEIILTLLGCENVPTEPFIVHGITATGKKITLHQCFISGRRISSPGIASVEITANLYFTGDHLAIDKFQFNSALLQISSLKYWVDIGGFEEFKSKDEFLVIKYKSPQEIVFYETEKVKFILLFQSTYPVFPPIHNCSITQDIAILIKSEKEFDLNTFWNYVSIINSFFTLAFFSLPKLYEIKFKKGVKVLDFVYAGQEDEESYEKKSKRKFLFTYRNIQNEFRVIFKKWSELHITIEPVLNVLQESFGSRNVIAENKFLNIVQGIETFHRRRRKNEKVTKNVYKEIVREVVQACPSQHEIWLKEKLNYANEPTLKERLTELFAEIDETLQNHLFPEVDEIIKNSKDSRNYYTHYNSSLEKKALKGASLFYLTERLKIFLLILLLKETDFDNDQTNIIVKEGSQLLFNHLINRNR